MKRYTSVTSVIGVVLLTCSASGQVPEDIRKALGETAPVTKASSVQVPEGESTPSAKLSRAAKLYEEIAGEASAIDEDLLARARASIETLKRIAAAEKPRTPATVAPKKPDAAPPEKARPGSTSTVTSKEDTEKVKAKGVVSAPVDVSVEVQDLVRLAAELRAEADRIEKLAAAANEGCVRVSEAQEAVLLGLVRALHPEVASGN